LVNEKKEPGTGWVKEVNDNDSKRAKERPFFNTVNIVG